jgi:hypothetical protein
MAAAQACRGGRGLGAIDLAPVVRGGMADWLQTWRPAIHGSCPWPVSSEDARQRRIVPSTILLSESNTRS